MNERLQITLFRSVFLRKRLREMSYTAQKYKMSLLIVTFSLSPIPGKQSIGSISTSLETLVKRINVSINLNYIQNFNNRLFYI